MRDIATRTREFAVRVIRFELLRDTQILAWDRLAERDKEADELTAILVTLVKKRKTAKP